MKKVLLGCSLFVFVATLALVAGGYFFVYRPVSGFVDDMRGVAEQFDEVASLDEQIENQQPFEAPADGLLTAEQVERYVAVQRAIEATGQGDAYAQRVEDFEESTGGEAAGADEALDRLRQVPERLQLMAQSLIALKRAQIEALNAQGFSAQEYAWVKRQFYYALGFVVVPSNLERMRDQLDQVGQGAGPGQNIELDLEAPTGAVEAAEDVAPEANRELVAPYREEASGWMTWAPFGL